MSSAVPILGLALYIPATAAQTISDRIRDARENHPGSPVVIGKLGEPSPMSLEELTKTSDLIVEARLRRLESYIDDTDTAVLTRFSIDLIRALRGSIPSHAATPTMTPPLTLIAYGGEVVREGITVRAVNHDSEMFQDGRTYLLFLKKVQRERGVYVVNELAAFELTGDTLRPIGRHGPDLYRDFKDTAYDQVLRLLRRLGPAR
jgi:hypothetical protein